MEKCILKGYSVCQKYQNIEITLKNCIWLKLHFDHFSLLSFCDSTMSGNKSVTNVLSWWRRQQAPLNDLKDFFPLTWFYSENRTVTGEYVTDKFINHIITTGTITFSGKEMETHTFTFIIYALYSIYLHLLMRHI